MKISTSKLTQKFQATVPAPVRKKLKLHAGDTIAFEIKSDGILVRKARPFDMELCSALTPTLSEWNSPNDEESSTKP